MFNLTFLKTELTLRSFIIFVGGRRNPYILPQSLILVCQEEMSILAAYSDEKRAQ